MSVKESSSEIEFGQPYYSFSLTDILTLAQVVEKDGVGYPDNPDEKVDEEAKKWDIDGFDIDVDLVEAMCTDAWCERNSGERVTLAVEDDGPEGDTGLWLSMDVKDWNEEGSEHEGRELMAIQLSPRQAKRLAEALLMAVKLRGESEDK